MMQNKYLALLAFFLAFAATSASAQRAGTDTTPGASCAGVVTGAVQMSPDPTGNSASSILVCNGTTWQPAGLQLGNDAASCTADKDGTIRYVSGGSPPWQYCDGGTTSWIPFRQPRCQDDDTGECFLQMDRDADDPQFEPNNIACGVNILGVTGILGDDEIPNAFAFTDISGQPINTTVESNSVQITGMDCLLNVFAGGDGSPEYRICDDASCTLVDTNWTTGINQIGINQFVQLRLTTSFSYLEDIDASATVGGYADTWTVTTCDGIPDQFVFSDLTDQPVNTTVMSDIVEITGMDCSAEVQLGGDNSGEFRICNDSGCSSVDHNWTDNDRDIDPGQYLQLSVRTDGYNDTNSVVPEISGITTTWSATSRCDNVPDAFAFQDISNQTTSTLVASNIVQISGIDAACPADISVAGAGSPQFQICSDSACSVVLESWTTSAQIEANQYVQLQITTPAVNHTSNGALVDVSGVTDTWYAAAGCNTAAISYDSAGTYSYIFPDGCSTAWVEAWGGGGGDGNGGTGGGGGAYAAETFALVGSTAYNVTVGNGGNRGNDSQNGSPGGNSYFDTGALLLAAGGGRGEEDGRNPGIGGQAAASIGSVKYSGGDGGDTYDEGGGGGGGAAGNSADGGDGLHDNAGGGGGAGGVAGGGNGGAGGEEEDEEGDPGSAPGGGGGGGEDDNGGAGANGRVLITPSP